MPISLQRARALKYLLENQSIFIGADELIVGERGPQPKAASTYPELCCHSLDDLDILPSRRKTPFLVDEETRTLYEETVIPFWSGNSMRDRVFAAMSDEWREAFDAGVFTEFMEQRAPGHAVLDDKIYRAGLEDFKDRIKAARERIAKAAEISEDDAQARLNELEAMSICCDAVIRFAERHAELARKLAETAKNAL